MYCIKYYNFALKKGAKIIDYCERVSGISKFKIIGLWFLSIESNCF